RRGQGRQYRRQYARYAELQSLATADLRARYRVHAISCDFLVHAMGLLFATRTNRVRRPHHTEGAEPDPLNEGIARYLGAIDRAHRAFNPRGDRLTTQRGDSSCSPSDLKPSGSQRVHEMP